MLKHIINTLPGKVLIINMTRNPLSHHLDSYLDICDMVWKHITVAIIAYLETGKGTFVVNREYSQVISLFYYKSMVENIKGLELFL